MYFFTGVTFLVDALDRGLLTSISGILLQNIAWLVGSFNTAVGFYVLCSNCRPRDLQHDVQLNQGAHRL